MTACIEDNIVDHGRMRPCLEMEEHDTLPAGRARDFMSTPPRTLRGDDSALELVRLMCDECLHHVLVVDSAKRLIGLVSDRDFLRSFGPHDKTSQLAETKVAQIMTRSVITAGAEDSVRSVVSLFTRHGIGCVPIMLGENPVGIITRSDLLRVLENILG